MDKTIPVPPNFFDFCKKITPPCDQSSQLPSNTHLNMLLYTIWHALSQHGRLKIKEFKIIDQKLNEWEHLLNYRIQTIQHRLTQSKSNKINQLNKKLQPELQHINQLSNHIEQEFITHAFLLLKPCKRSPQQILADACSNIATYLKIKKTNLNCDNLQFIQSILQQTFSDLHPVSIDHQLKNKLKSAKISSFDSLQLTFEDL